MENDTHLREQFSKVLNAPVVYEQEYGYSSRKAKPTVYTWEQIFFEVGKLKERAGANLIIEGRHTTH